MTRSPFHSLDRAMGAVIDRVMGERLIYRPMRRMTPNGASSADPLRSTLEVLAPFDEPAARLGSGPARRIGLDTDANAHISARPSVALTLADLPWRPRKYDRIERVDTGETFEIVEIMPDGLGTKARLDLNLIVAP